MNISELFARVITFFRVFLVEIPEVFNNKNRFSSRRGCGECGQALLRNTSNGLSKLCG